MSTLESTAEISHLSGPSPIGTLTQSASLITYP
jgi:hypothetical protein